MKKVYSMSLSERQLLSVYLDYIKQHPESYVEERELNQISQIFQTDIQIFHITNSAILARDVNFS